MFTKNLVSSLALALPQLPRDRSTVLFDLHTQQRQNRSCEAEFFNYSKSCEIRVQHSSFHKGPHPFSVPWIEIAGFVESVIHPLTIGVVVFGLVAEWLCNWFVSMCPELTVEINPSILPYLTHDAGDTNHEVLLKNQSLNSKKLFFLCIAKICWWWLKKPKCALKARVLL